jgi:hypothetical protein
VAAFTPLFQKPQIRMLQNTTNDLVSTFQFKCGRNKPDVHQNNLLYTSGTFFLTTKIQEAISFSYKTEGKRYFLSNDNKMKY